jgi:eukaryotic-like serine/threonine-protein kinase
MPLSAGTRVGPYEILSALGAGGVGEVYRARDRKLDRDVAIKVLADAVATDPERLARFEREAKTLAALNHPNIAHIHGFDDSTGVPALVMELVEGPTLADRIARRPILIDEALPIAKQIAEALEGAHEQGIIHRDLKPANIKVREDGTVKVLDFGLAKAMDPLGSSSAAAALANSPTMTSPAVTVAGVLLGTAAYMSPEQARGKPVDQRADIWAFGAVLFEMLTGRRAFDGDDLSTTIASVMLKEPDWSALPASTPVGVRQLLTRCLKKDVKTRLQAIGDARVQIEELLSGAPDVVSTAAGGAESQPIVGTRQRIVALATAALLVALISVAATRALMRTPSAKRQLMRFAIAPPAAQPLAISRADRDLALSPDGTHLVYVSAGGRLMLRAIDQLDIVPLSGPTAARGPFFSPDGRWIGYFTGGASGELKKVPVAGGPPLTLCRYQGLPQGAS